MCCNMFLSTILKLSLKKKCKKQNLFYSGSQEDIAIGVFVFKNIIIKLAYSTYAHITGANSYITCSSLVAYV